MTTGWTGPGNRKSYQLFLAHWHNAQHALRQSKCRGGRLLTQQLQFCKKFDSLLFWKIRGCLEPTSLEIPADIAMRLKRKVRWNPDEERFVDDDQADSLLSKSVRASWNP
jgi:hypothetical protein